jgi:amino acid transporter
VPRAVVGSALLVGIFFLLTTYASTVYFGPNKMSGFLSYNEGNGWIGLSKTLWGGGWILLLITLLNSSLACANGAAMAATRSIWAMGHAGTIPRFFAKTHPRWHSPVNAVYVLFGVGTIMTFVAGAVWDPVTAYALFGTILTITVLPIYFLAALACPIYYLRFRRGEFNLVLHLIIPVLGAAFLVPAFFAGTGIRAFSFVSSLTYPLNLAGPTVAVWYGLGIVIMVFLLIKKRANLDRLSDAVAEDPVTAERPAAHAYPSPALALE